MTGLAQARGECVLSFGDKNVKLRFDFASLADLEFKFLGMTKQIMPARDLVDLSFSPMVVALFIQHGSAAFTEVDFNEAVALLSQHPRYAWEAAWPAIVKAVQAFLRIDIVVKEARDRGNVKTPGGEFETESTAD